MDTAAKRRDHAFNKSPFYGKARLEMFFEKDMCATYGKYGCGRGETPGDVVYRILSAGGTYAMAAKELRVTERVLRRWKTPVQASRKDPSKRVKNPQFKEDFAYKCALAETAQWAAYDKICIDVLKNPVRDFPQVVYFWARKHLHHLGDERLCVLEDYPVGGTMRGQLDYLASKFAQGVISAGEFNKAAQAVAGVCAAKEREDLRLAVDALNETSPSAAPALLPPSEG